MATTKTTIDPVLTYVRRTLSRTPDLSSSELYDRAAKLYPKVRKLNVRQFHARYPLRVKLAQARAGGAVTNPTGIGFMYVKPPKKATRKRAAKRPPLKRASLKRAGTAKRGVKKGR